MPKFSPLLPRPSVDKYDGLHTMAPRLRTGMQRVMNGKPNRGASARATNRFMAEYVVPFPFIGPDRAELDRKGRIPTPRKHEHAERRMADWVNPSL